ncbi:DUF7350 domain-containing protein [Natronorarus salvus]|uniref:DUF7350 domain-containing protein n=1 Tax=Natronorarus salvus TaxID=3117733 RepID=UPI002F2650F6
MRRRELLGVLVGAGGLALPGRLDRLGHEATWRELVVNRPDVVYLPAKYDGMLTYAVGETDEYLLSLSATVPHPFFTVTGTEANQANVYTSDSVHLMVDVRDRETGRVIPSNVSLALSREGETVEERVLWPMLSQRMGFHYGDTFSLPEDGSYSARIGVDPVAASRVGTFAGRFADRQTLDVGIEFSEGEIDDLECVLIDVDRRGRPGALPPMEHDDHGHGDGVEGTEADGEHDHRDDHDEGGHGDRGDGTEHEPSPERLASPSSLPGEVLGVAESGDARVAATVIGGSSTDGPGSYLAVSPRTPHNAYPLPTLALSARVRDGDDVRFDGPLPEAVGPELGVHYGAEMPGVGRGNEVRIAVDAPPQLARHEGYETAFLDMDPVRFDH